MPMSLWDWKDLTLKSTHHNRSKCSKICKINTHLNPLLSGICAFTCFFTCHQQTDCFCQRKREGLGPGGSLQRLLWSQLYLQTGGCIRRFASRLEVDLELSSHVKMFHQSQMLPLKGGEVRGRRFQLGSFKGFHVGTLLPAHSWSQPLETTS